MQTIKWKTIIGLILLVLAIYFNIGWAWGVLFLFWAITDLINKRTYFIEDVPRSTNPILYWIIVVIWLGLAIYSFIPEWWWYR